MCGRPPLGKGVLTWVMAGLVRFIHVSGLFARSAKGRWP